MAYVFAKSTIAEREIIFDSRKEIGEAAKYRE